MRRLLLISSCLLLVATGAGVVSLSQRQAVAAQPPPSFSLDLARRGGTITVMEVVLPEANGQQSGAPGTISIEPSPGFHMENPGDTLAYNITWAAGARATGYSVTVTAVPATGWTNLPTSFLQTGTTFLLRAINSTQPDVNFTITVCSRKASITYTNKCAVASWSVTRVPGPPGIPVVDSSMTVVGLRDWEMVPENPSVWRSLTAAEWSTWDAQSVAAGAPQGYRDSVHAVYEQHAQIQFCSIGYFTDNSRYPLGTFAMPADSVYCVNQAQLKYPGWGNSPNARAFAKSICIQYNATGGTISTGPSCSAPVPFNEPASGA
jgi:hypothetical protein